MATRSVGSSRFVVPIGTQQSLSFNGTSDYATCPIVPSTTNVNVACWVFIKSDSTSGSRFVDWQSAADRNGFMFKIDTAAGTRLVVVSSATAAESVQVTGKMGYGSWLHLAWTYTANSSKFYANGVLLATDTSVVMTSNANPLTLARAAYSAGGYGSCLLKNFTIHNATPWTATEVTDLYYRNKIPSGAVQYSMNGVATDQNGGNALTLIGTSYSSNAPFQPRTTAGRRLLNRSFGNALKFDGTASYATLPITPSVTAFSASFWIKMNTYAANNRILDWQASGPVDGFTIINDSAVKNSIGFAIRNGASFVSNIVSGQLELGKWYHLTATYEVNSVKLYINAVQIGATDTSATMTTAASTLTIGRRSTSTSAFFAGEIDEFLFYSRVLTLSEIENLYYASSIPSGSTVLLNFNASSGVDISGNGNDATLISTSFSTNVPMTTRTAV